MSYILIAYITGLLVKLSEEANPTLNTVIQAVAYPIPVSVALVKLTTTGVTKIKSLFGGNNASPTV